MNEKIGHPDDYVGEVDLEINLTDFKVKNLENTTPTSKTPYKRLDDSVLRTERQSLFKVQKQQNIVHDFSMFDAHPFEQFWKTFKIDHWIIQRATGRYEIDIRYEDRKSQLYYLFENEVDAVLFNLRWSE